MTRIYVQYIIKFTGDVVNTHIYVFQKNRFNGWFFYN